MAELIYMDNSNVFIEGQRVSAIAKGMVMNVYDSINHKVLDGSYRLDFGKLYHFLTGGNPDNVKRAILFGSRPPENDSVWNAPKRAGFEVELEDRNAANKEKKIDTGIVTRMVEDSYELADKSADTITLVAGDGDYVPTVRRLKERGFKVEVAFWEHASAELKRECTRFISLDQHLAALSK